MKICVTDFVEGARAARGVVVVIDVFRAFSVACYALAGGADRIIPVADIDEALAWKKKKPDILMIGERHAKKIEGFDFGNSPSEVEQADLKGRTIVHTTHAGTQGLVNAVNADRILTGSLVNAAATAAWIRWQNPAEVTLVRMGFEAERRTDEDDICALYLNALLDGRSFDTAGIRRTLLESPCSARFFDPSQPWNPPRDFDLCLEIDRFPFPVLASRSQGFLSLKKAVQG